MPQTKQVKDIQERKVIWSDDKFNYCPDPAVLAQIQQALNTNQTLSVAFAKNTKGFWDVKSVTPVTTTGTPAKTEVATIAPVVKPKAVAPNMVGGVSPQEHGMFIKELGEWFRLEKKLGKEVLKKTPQLQAMKALYWSELSRAVGIEVSPVEY